ncbi:hypothetical protein [Tunicatimonas pelagia]|uniref:hypothetical protein n=1 Tax=Tunicatimonas pelagia TaxID=931531 RepID=UPI002666F897|nr:hypothetical protein [Tunicatimonas pelagia]WKN45416.1 hypothetical protein P0M28_10650 [Tunicatimonas pelagia]
MTDFNHDLQFDDTAILEDTLGEGSLSLTAVTGNCDCSGYTSIQEDEEIDTPESTRTPA